MDGYGGTKCCSRCARKRLPLDVALGSSLGAPALSGGLSGTGGSPVGRIGVPAAAGSLSSSLGSEGTSSGARDLPLAGEASLDGTSANLIGAGNLGLLHTGRVLVLLGLGVAVEVQIGHDVPLSLAGSERAAETEDLTGEHPPDQTNGVTTLVVGGDGHVDELGGGVGVAEGLSMLACFFAIYRRCTYNDRDVDV